MELVETVRVMKSRAAEIAVMCSYDQANAEVIILWENLSDLSVHNRSEQPPQLKILRVALNRREQLLYSSNLRVSTTVRSSRMWLFALERLEEIISYSMDTKWSWRCARNISAPSSSVIIGLSRNAIAIPLYMCKGRVAGKRSPIWSSRRRRRLRRGQKLNSNGK